MARYEEVYRRSIENPQAFWAEAAQDIEWVRRPRAIVNETDPHRVSWFPGGMLNTCYNAVDLHVLAGRGDQAALIYDSPVTGSCRTSSYRELQLEVAKLAAALQALDVERGDRVLIYMPMVPKP